MTRDFREVFPVPKPVIGMIHLAGTNSAGDKVYRALEELRIYQEEGVDGAIIEDYHGSFNDVLNTLNSIFFSSINIGINLLRDPFTAFSLADRYNLKFIQIDSVQTQDLRVASYNLFREEFPNVAVLGGVGFKYTKPTGNPLEADLREGISRCEAIVTTGSGTGIETPLAKLQEYKRVLGNFPLISGAGVTAENVYDQLQIVDGIIVGSYFKPEGNTELKVERQRVKSLMDIVRQVREEIKS